MSVFVSMTLKAKPENAEQLKTFFRDEVQHTRRFDGCNDIAILTAEEDPNELLVLGDWESKEQHQAYVAWRAEKGDVDRFMAWLSEDPTAQYFDRARM